MAERLVLHYSKTDQVGELISFVNELPPDSSIRLKFQSDRDTTNVLYKLVRTDALNEVDLWTFINSNLAVLNLTTPFWWWKCLTLAENAKKWGLMRLMLESQTKILTKQWQKWLLDCGRRLGPDDINGHAFVIYLADKLPTKNAATLGYLVTAYTQTNEHAKAIEAFKELHKLNKDPGHNSTPYKSAKKSFIALGYDAEAKQIDEILDWHTKATTPAS